MSSTRPQKDWGMQSNSDETLDNNSGATLTWATAKPVAGFFVAHLCAVASLVLISLSVPFLKKVNVYAAITLWDLTKVIGFTPVMHAAALLLAPLILPAFTAWLRPVGLLTSRHNSRHATFIGYSIMFFTAALYAFSLAYVFANSARHARTEKIYPITGERNSQVMEDTLYALDELAGHWFPIACVWALFMLAALREACLPYFELRSRPELVLCAGLGLVVAVIDSIGLGVYAHEGNCFFLMYPLGACTLAVAVAVKAGCGQLRDIYTQPVATFVVATSGFTLLATGIVQAVTGSSLMHGLPGVD